MNKNLKKCKKYGLDLEKLSEMYEYSNVESFKHSSAYKRILKATVKIIQLVENKIIDDLQK